MKKYKSIVKHTIFTLNKQMGITNTLMKVGWTSDVRLLNFPATIIGQGNYPLVPPNKIIEGLDPHVSPEIYAYKDSNGILKT